MVQPGNPTGVSLGAVQHWEIDNTPPNASALVKIRDVFDVNINWLFTGGGSPYIIMVYPKGANVPEPPDEPNLEDFKAVIKNFMDKPYATEISINLVELEPLSPEAYRKVGSYIKGIVDGVKMMSSAGKPPDHIDRRKGERRSDDPEGSVDVEERRSGRDRRSNVG